MNGKTAKDAKAVAMIATTIWIKSEILRSPVQAAKLIGPEFTRQFVAEFQARYKMLKDQWERTPKNERAALRAHWLKTSQANAENAKLKQPEIDMARDIVKSL